MKRYGVALTLSLSLCILPLVESLYTYISLPCRLHCPSLYIKYSFKYPVRFGWTTVAEAAVTLELETPNTVALFKPFDEKKMSKMIEKPLEATEKSKQEMAGIMNQIIGVPVEEAMKLIPTPKEARELTQW